MVKDLGEEVLLRIFSKLQKSTLKQCQKVCRAWYAPAHILYLKDIRLWDANIERFVASIDSNPKPAYLNAVKSITVVNKKSRGKDQTPPTVDLQKLFFRFSNLESIVVHGHFYFFDGFNDATCKSLLTSCPKLETFELPYVSSDQTQYCNTLYKLRSILTSMPMDVIETVSKCGYSPPIFPRVKKLVRNEDLSDVLPLLKMFPALDAMYSSAGGDHDLNRMLKKKSSAELDQYREALSRVTTLEMQTGFGLSRHTSHFIMVYFKGIENFKITSHYIDERYGVVQYKDFFNDELVYLVSSAQKKGQIVMKNYGIPEKFLKYMLNQVFQYSSGNRVLRLEVADNNDDNDDDSDSEGCRLDSGTVYKTIDMEFKPDERKFTLQCADSWDISSTFESISLKYIDEVQFYLPASEWSPDYRKSDIDKCKEVLKKLKPAKKATLKYGNTIVKIK